MSAIRQRWHPLHALRRIALFRFILRRFDRPIWVRLRGVNHPVRLRLVRNASYLLSPSTTEPQLGALFVTLHRLFAPARFYDIGANIGYYSWLLKSLNREIEIVMFEPDPINSDLIVETAQRAQLKGVTVLTAAVSDSIGAASFAVDAISSATGTLNDPTHSFVAHHYGVLPDTITVATTTVDRTRWADGVDVRVDLIKIDIEGHEWPALRGAKKTLNEDNPILVFECFTDSASILSMLQENGYLILDAERMTRDLDQATNFLALPSKHASAVTELLSAWKTESQAWTRSRSPTP